MQGIVVSPEGARMQMERVSRWRWTNAEAQHVPARVF
jgi:hypothetical protein